MNDLASRLVEEWAADRLTHPTSAERDLAQWIVERLDESPEFTMAKAALDSWSRQIDAIKAALSREVS